MKTLSIVLSTFNEEKNLARCLESVKDIADEIILVDGSSTDNTVAIAKKYKAKVTVTDNPPIFLINRQKAIDKASKDWLLQVDADEEITPALTKEIQAVLKSEKTVNGYWIPRKNWFLGRFLTKGGQYPDYMLRLYKRGKVHFALKDVHEQAIVDGEVGYLTAPMLHYPYADFSAYLLKWKRYNEVFAKQISDERQKKSFLIQIGMGIDYLVVKPLYWFLLTYIRHKGFVDLFSGFVFSLFSALRFPVSYSKSFSYRNRQVTKEKI